MHIRPGSCPNTGRALTPDLGRPRDLDLDVQENGCPVVMKHYPPEFRADAVALYASRPGATIKHIAADPGVNPETPRNWIRTAGAGRPRGRNGEPARSQTPVEAELAAARRRIRELEEEKGILGRVAKHFAGEARWRTAAGSLRTTSAVSASSGCVTPSGSPAPASTTGAGPRPSGPPARPPTPSSPREYARCTRSRTGPTASRGSRLSSARAASTGPLPTPAARQA